MESFRSALSSLCPHLSLNISDAKILNDAEIVFFFPITDDVTPLTDMLKKYKAIEHSEHYDALFVMANDILMPMGWLQKAAEAASAAGPISDTSTSPTVVEDIESRALAIIPMAIPIALLPMAVPPKPPPKATIRPVVALDEVASNTEFPPLVPGEPLVPPAPTVTK
jgi:hypothetical protein